MAERTPLYLDFEEGRVVEFVEGTDTFPPSISSLATFLTVTENYNITNDDDIINCSGTFSVTLPGVITGRKFTIINSWIGEITVLVNDAETETINVEYNIILQSGDGMTVVGAVNKWLII
jgi:hypothetical protein